MRIAFFAHCNFLGNSAMHVFSLVEHLQVLGHECVIAVPDSPETVLRHREPICPIGTYDEIIADSQLSGHPDLVHAWTPREHVRRATEAFVARHGCPYIVHLEDNEEKIVEDEVALDYTELKRLPADVISRLIGDYRSHPRRYPQFVARAVGVTCLTQPLTEFAGPNQLHLVFHPGFEDRFAEVVRADDDVRAQYGIAPHEVVFLYSGNIHPSVLKDVRSLLVALVILHRRGVPVRLVKTGWNHDDPGVPEAAAFTLDLGFVDRAEIPTLLSLADILVQPGRSDRFNDYRVPSKLPEYLASGRPTILPDSNIGLLIEDGVQALKLTEGTADELVGKILQILDSPQFGERLGAAGRRFAVEALSWRNAAAALSSFYEQVCTATPASAEVRPLYDADAHDIFPVKLVAFYLPQFHPIPENDRWWGKGFTEWTNVSRARPQFPGHDHPRMPTDFGYYDLRLPEAMHAQAALARAYGIHAFCFYYYWFNGRRLLERPLDIWLSERGPDFPFMICWANENWSRRWDGSDSEILIDQLYRPEDDEAFICDVLPILKDRRYMRVDDAPVLLLYRVTLLPDPVRTAGTWRRICRENGIPRLHLCVVQSFGIKDPRPFGFDAAVEFPPLHFERQLVEPPRFGDLYSGFEGYLEDYISVALHRINAQPNPYIHYRGITPCWDNTARRRQHGHILVNDSPKAYGQWLRFLAHEALLRSSQQEPLVFVNAWNEWAEGAYLEPDERYGLGLLEVTKDALSEAVIDFLQGPSDERERAFTHRISRVPRNSLNR